MILLKRHIPISIICLSVVITALSGCTTTPPMAVDYDTQYNFANIISYRWATSNEAKQYQDTLPTKASQKSNTNTVTHPAGQTHDLLKKRVTRSVDNALAQKGLSLDSNNATAILVQNIVLKKRTVRETHFYDLYSIDLEARYHGYYGYGRHERCTSYAHCVHDSLFGLSSVSTEREHTRLILMLSLLDTQQKHMIWKGAIGLPFNKKNQSPEAYDAVIHDRIQQLLSKLPSSHLSQSTAPESH